jgi:hypothetical protein
VEIFSSGDRPPVVQLLHKSVLDFLCEDNVWSILVSITPRFDPDRVLAAACLLSIKTSGGSPKDPAIRPFLAYLHAGEKMPLRTQIEPLRECIQVLHASIQKQESNLQAAYENQKTEYPIHLSRATASRVALTCRITKTGLYRYIDHICTQSADEQPILRDLDASALFVRTLWGMISQFRISSGYSYAIHAMENYPKTSLAREYSCILISFLTYLEKLLGPTSAGRHHAWMHTLNCLTEVQAATSNWTESAENLNLLKALLAVIDAFLKTAMDVNHYNSSVFGELGANWHTEGTGPEYRTVSSRSGADILMSWMEYETGRLTPHNPEEAIVLTEIKRLQTVIESQKSTTNDEIIFAKQKEWSLWLSRSKDVPSRATPISTVIDLGGPFELECAELRPPGITCIRSHVTSVRGITPADKRKEWALWLSQKKRSVPIPLPASRILSVHYQGPFEINGSEPAVLKPFPVASSDSTSLQTNQTDAASFELDLTELDTTRPVREREHGATSQVFELDSTEIGEVDSIMAKGPASAFVTGVEIEDNRSDLTPHFTSTLQMQGQQKRNFRRRVIHGWETFFKK